MQNHDGYYQGMTSDYARKYSMVEQKPLPPEQQRAEVLKAPGFEVPLKAFAEPVIAIFLFSCVLLVFIYLNRKK